MKKLILYGVVALSVFALSACESKPKQPKSIENGIDRFAV